MKDEPNISPASGVVQGRRQSSRVRRFASNRAGPGQLARRLPCIAVLGMMARTSTRGLPMKSTAGLIVLMTLSQNPTVPAPNSSDVSELSRLESAWNQAHVEGDAKILDRLWADDLTVTVPKMPRFNKSQSLQIWRSGRMKFQKYDTSGVQIHLYGNSAVVTGQLRRTRVLGARTINDDWQFTKTYVRGPSGWQVVAFHASEAPPISPQK